MAVAAAWLWFRGADAWLVQATTPATAGIAVVVLAAGTLVPFEVGPVGPALDTAAAPVAPSSSPSTSAVGASPSAKPSAAAARVGGTSHFPSRSVGAPTRRSALPHVARACRQSAV